MAASCVEPYQPVLKPGVLDILSVDGFINATSSSALVIISHVKATDDFTAPIFESGAVVRIGSSDGNTFQLAEEGPGRYSTEDMSLNFNSTYTLNVLTNSGREIRSGEILLQRTPPIDSVRWRLSNDEEGISIMVNTHNDDVSGLRRYTWDFVETYEYVAKYYSGFKKVNNMPVPRGEADLIYRCWATENSPRVIIGNSLAFAENKITNFSLTTIHKGSRKLSIRYSTLVRQRCIDNAEYEFLDAIKKTTEQLGGLFDPVPYPVIGNLEEVTNVRMPVLGYFSVGEVTEMRTFIEFGELPSEVRVKPAFPPCMEEDTCPPGVQGFGCLQIQDVAMSPSVFTTMATNERGMTIGYGYVREECADCRKYGGGVTTRPDFW